MLKSLYIDNIAVIEHAEPVFSSGLNILTGETGAGKSIIVDSINAILGERTSRDLIRNGSNNARIVAVFDNVSNECKEVFKNYEIYDDNGSYIISRTLSLSGKNTCKINNIPVNTIVLKEIGKHLITIHGQHDNQLLLSAENHIFFVDNFLKQKSIFRIYLAKISINYPQCMIILCQFIEILKILWKIKQTTCKSYKNRLK